MNNHNATPYRFPRPGDPVVIPSAGVRSALEQQMKEQGTAGQSAAPPGFAPQPTLIHEPGGDVVRELVHPAFTIFDQMYRVLPEGTWFDPSVSPQKPVQFELGAFTVPPGTNLWLFDYEFTVFRQSGIDPADIVPAEEGRFSGVLGFDLNFSGRRMTNLMYQLDPVAVQISRPTFQPAVGQRAVAAQFNVAASQNFASNASPGLSLLPVTSRRQGARDAPFTLVAGEGDRVSLNAVIFRPVPSPIVTIQGRSAGFLLHTNVSQALMNRLRPT